MYRLLLQNHVLANLTFLLMLFIGFIAYNTMPRQQDPTINFNWISVITVLGGASAEDVEKRITEPLEDAISGVADIDFVSSNSRNSISSILVRFEEIDERTFDKRIADLRREIQNAQSNLPDDATDPTILEITSSNGFPTAMIAVRGVADDTNLHAQASKIEKDLEQIVGVDRVDTTALNDPELQVRFDMEALEQLNLSPMVVADSVRAWMQDLSAGEVDIDNQSWLIRLEGKTSDPQVLAELPIPSMQGEIPLGRVATIESTRTKAAAQVRLDGEPSILLTVIRRDATNVIDLVGKLKHYIDTHNEKADATGVELVLVDDQTIPTQEAINLMESNALIGLLLVLVVAFFFLGGSIAFFTAIGIPFILAITFWVLSLLGETLNVTVLLGVVIVLGMLVDDAVVVVEAIHYRIQRGMQSLDACIDAMREVALPVTTAVLTTIAAFMPLMLLPGILGKFMKVIPMVVTLALAISLIEAFWMLPSHVTSVSKHHTKPSRMQRIRQRFTHWVQIKYSKLLIWALRHPISILTLTILMFFSSIGVIGAGLIPVDFFAADKLRLFYVNVDMPRGTSLDATMQKTLEVEQRIRKYLKPTDQREVITYAGMKFTQIEPLYANNYGQINVSLKPLSEGSRPVSDIIEEMRKDVTSVIGPVDISFLELANGPPATKPISVKIRGDNMAELREVTMLLSEALASNSGIKNITNDSGKGTKEMSLALRHDVIRRVGISPSDVVRTVSLMVNGEVVADMQEQGEKLEVRVKADKSELQSVDQILDFRMQLPSGDSIPLRELVVETRRASLANIRHYNFRRAITLEADIVQRPTAPMYECRIQPLLEETPIDYGLCGLDTVQANKLLLEAWDKHKNSYPNINLDFSGQLDDIQESMDSMVSLLLFGVGAMYLILGTQFRSYFQPLLILVTVPMAFTGVVLGLFLTQNPLSLYTLYGVVALAGIAVNAAIVLISAANDRRKRGMSTLHATVYAARRRVIPIMITTLTTIAGLFSLATGLGGQSLVWGPVATAIVWGVGFSSTLTLFVIPVLYRQFNKKALQPA